MDEVGRHEDESGEPTWVVCKADVVPYESSTTPSTLSLDPQQCDTTSRLWGRLS